MSVSENVLLDAQSNDLPDIGTNWFGYKYLGPGTDVKHHISTGVKPVDELDAAAQKHDIVYHNISKLYEEGKISKRQAEILVDKADWTLANRSAVTVLKSPFKLDNLVDLVSGRPHKSALRLLKAYPALYTSTVMRGKVLLSKLGIGRGSFANLKRRR